LIRCWSLPLGQREQRWNECSHAHVPMCHETGCNGRLSCTTWHQKRNSRHTIHEYTTATRASAIQFMVHHLITISCASAFLVCERDMVT